MNVHTFKMTSPLTQTLNKLVELAPPVIYTSAFLWWCGCFQSEESRHQQRLQEIRFKIEEKKLLRELNPPITTSNTPTPTWTRAPELF